MNRMRFTVLILIASWCVCAGQQQLTLQRCIELAKAFSLKSRASDIAIRASALSRDELATARLPQFKFSTDVSLAPTSSKSGYDPAITDGGQLGSRIVVEQSLYDAGVRNLKSGQLSAEHDALMKEKQVTERDLVFAVEQFYLEALRSQREIELQRESMTQLKEYLELVQRLSMGGGSSYTDVLKTQIQLQTAERSLENAAAASATAKYALAELMGGAIDTAFSVSGSLESLLPETRREGIPRDVSQNLDIALAQLNINKSLFDAEIARSERLPAVSAFADAGLLTSFDNLHLPASERSGMYGFSVGVSFELPIFTWGATDLRIQQRQLATEALGLELEGIRRSVATEFQKTQLQLAKSDQRLRSLRTSLKAAEENFVLTKAKYAAGSVLSLEVLSAQQLLTDLKLEELQTLADKQSLLAKQEQLMTR